MIQVDYFGRLGNRLFQYTFGRLLAENKGYALKAKPIPGFPGTYDNVDGYSTDESVLKSKGHVVDMSELLEHRGKILLRGYYQRCEYYQPYRNQIKQWLRFDNRFRAKPPHDVVVHIRNGDFIQRGYDLPWSFFQRVLGGIKYDNLYVCSDSPTGQTVAEALEDGAQLFHEGVIEDFQFISSFNRIILSPSTFGWWAAYLSKANKIYIPITQRGYWSDERPDVDLMVPESRYVFIRE